MLIVLKYTIIKLIPSVIEASDLKQQVPVSILHHFYRCSKVPP